MLLDEMEIFYYVVEFKSFSKAAEKLKVSKSFISKKISRLEQYLKVRLLSRSTRKLILTEAGENFFQYCANVVQNSRDAFSRMHQLQDKPSGLLKISIPPALGLNLIAPMLSKFLGRYPEVSLDIELDNKLVDLIGGGFDLALRSAKLESSNLIAQKIYSIKNIICGTPHYFQKHGMPKKPQDLQSHNFGIYSYTKKAKHIRFIKNGSIEKVSIDGNFSSNQLDLIKQMALKDVCLALLPEFMVTQELQDKKLITCLNRYQLSESNLYAIYPEREFMLPKLKCFLEMLNQHLETYS